MAKSILPGRKWLIGGAVTAVAGIVVFALVRGPALTSVSSFLIGGEPAASPAFTPPARGIACQGEVCYVNGKATPLPKPTFSDVPTPIPTVKIPNFIKVTVPTDRSWGCTPKRGELCHVPFEGVVFLETADQGKIILEAVENQAKKPAASRTLAPATKGRNILCTRLNCPFGGSLLPYTVGLQAKVVTFFVTLQDMNGKTLARSEIFQWVLAPT